jgi:hypothetical protein
MLTIIFPARACGETNPLHGYIRSRRWGFSSQAAYLAAFSFSRTRQLRAPRRLPATVRRHRVRSGRLAVWRSPKRKPPKSNPLPVGLSQRVEEIVQRIKHPDFAEEQRQILERMMTDKRMMPKVWSVLSNRKRPSREFAYPAIRREGTENLTNDEAQSEAFRELFHYAFLAARDKLMVSTLTDIEEHKEFLVKTAATMRSIAQDLDLATITGQLGVISDLDRLCAAHNSVALGMVANWLDSQARAHPRSDDLLVVERRTGDSIVRGVQILIAAKLEKLFGSPMHGIR